MVGLCLAPILILGIAALNYLTLDRHAAALRSHVMTSTNSGWKTKVQVSVGGLTLGAARTVLAVINPANAERARLGLQAVSRASVGVYQLEVASRRVAPEQLMADTDQGMRQRGWIRVVGVFDRRETVLVYALTGMKSEDTIDVCLAVLKERELVVASARLEAEALAELVRRNLPGELGGQRRRELQTAAR